MKSKSEVSSITDKRKRENLRCVLPSIDSLPNRFSIKEEHMHKYLMGSLLVLLWIIPVQAQQSRWENLNQLRRGTKVQVVEQSLKSTSGKFLSFSEEDLTLEVQGKEVIIARPQVYRVSISGKNRKRNTLIGTGVGAAVGTGIAVAILEREPGFRGAAAGAVAGWVGVGAGVGALMPAAREVYRAEAIPRSAPPRSAPSTDSFVESDRQP